MKETFLKHFSYWRNNGNEETKEDVKYINDNWLDIYENQLNAKNIDDLELEVFNKEREVIGYLNLKAINQEETMEEFVERNGLGEEDFKE